MSEAQGLSDFQRHCLYEACLREAEHLGGDEQTTEYFFLRAQTSRLWLSSRGEVTIADMDIRDWCAAIAWSAPGIRRQPRRAPMKQTVEQTAEQTVATQQLAANEPPDNEHESLAAPRKQARSGAKFRRPGA